MVISKRDELSVALWEMASILLVILLHRHLKVSIFMIKVIYFTLVKVFFSFVEVCKSVVHRRTIVRISISDSKTGLNHVF